MAEPTLVIEERPAWINDNLKVGRIIPFRKKRLIGPFCFIDHMGPARITRELEADVGSHPHIGLSTLTYMLSGGFLHLDSIGSRQEIRPGAVNWMTAGRGIVHAEKILPEFKTSGDATEVDANDPAHDLHGYQIWVALPREYETIEPSFAHVPGEKLPVWNDGDLEFRLVAGQAYGRRSPVPVYSPLYMIDVLAHATTRLDARELYGELGVVVVNGSARSPATVFLPGHMPVYERADECELEIEAGSRLLVFGGEAFPEKRFIDWNFVSSNKDRLDAARERWQGREFEMIPGEDSYVPYP